MSDGQNSELESGVNRQRLESLYARLPGSIVSVMVGVLLAFMILMESTPAELLKAWAAFMLTTMAMRGWLWQQYRSAVIRAESLKRWEWAYAVGMGLTALGWTVLCGPLFPTAPNLQNFVAVMIIFVAFSGMVLAADSGLAFVAFIVPTLAPALYRFYQMTGAGVPALMIVLSATAIMLVTYHVLQRSSRENMRRQIYAEQLLAEQQAIFQGATIGIAIIDNGRIVKCNKRFGELFGRGINALQELHALELFLNAEEGQRFIDWAGAEFDSGRSAQSMERMRRADGSQFWAEISGRRLHYGEHARNLWLIGDATSQRASQS